MPGEIVALLGPSGSGKSTMLQAVGLLEGGFGGTIEIAGIDASKICQAIKRTALRRDYLGFVYQFHHLLPDFNARRERRAAATDRGKPRARVRGAGAANCCSRLGLGERLDHRPEPAFGRRATARRRRPRACQPAAAGAGRRADRQSRRGDRRQGAGRVRQLVRGEGSAALVATHNERLAARMDRVVRLHEGVLE